MQKFALLALLLVLTACSRYHADPLTITPTLSQTLPSPVVDQKVFAISPWAQPATTSRQGFTMEQIAALAVLNNPDLKFARSDSGVGEAQAFAAGLLPDPQFSYGLNFAAPNQPGTATGVNYGLGYDTTALLFYSLRKQKAKAANQQLHLNLLWQEWQVISQARILYVKTLEQNRMLPLLEMQQSYLTRRYAHIQEALREGDTTLDIANADLNALTDLNQQIAELKRQINQTHHDLNALLNVDLSVNVPLSNQLVILPLDQAAVKKELANLIDRRPDLLALQAGYERQDLQYREAIWAQFPAITLNLMTGNDTTDVKASGFGVAFNIPLFNRNQGNIAIEKATRQKLHDEFTNRVNSTDSDVRSLLVDQHLLEQELESSQKALLPLQKASENATLAHQKGDIDEPTYRTFQQTYLTKQQAVINLEQSVLLQRIALQTLLGGELPVGTA